VIEKRRARALQDQVANRPAIGSESHELELVTRFPLRSALRLAKRRKIDTTC
jgi:hypothetical protein